MTVVVPAPLEPVTAMLGCLSDLRLSPDGGVLFGYCLPPCSARYALTWITP